MSGRHSARNVPANEPTRRRRQGPPRPAPGRAVLAIVLALAVIVGGGALVAKAMGGGSGAQLEVTSSAPGVCGSTKQLRVSAAPAMVAPLRAAVIPLSKPDSQGRCVDVKVDAQSSASVYKALGVAGAWPDAWVSDSTSWLQMARAAWAHNVTLPQVGEPLATSPVVLAGRAKELNSAVVAKQIDAWKGLFAGKPPAQNAGLILADPTGSTVGQLVLSKLPGATIATESGVKRLAAATRTITVVPDDVTARNAVLARAGAVTPMLEADVNAYNTSGADTTLGFSQLEGVQTADFSYIPVNPDSPDEVRLAALARLRSALTSTQAKESYVRAGLQPADEQPSYISAAAQKSMLGSWAQAGRRGRVLAVLDVSGSMGQIVPGTKRSRLDLAIQAGGQALAKFPGDSELGFWSFATNLTKTTDWEELVPVAPIGAKEVDGQSHGMHTYDVLSRLVPRPDAAGTGLYDTTLGAMRAARKTYKAGKLNVVAIMTDGKNEDPGSISLDTLLSTLKAEANPAAPVSLVMIGLGGDADAAELARIAKAGNGRSFTTTATNGISEVVIEALTSL